MLGAAATIFYATPVSIAFKGGTSLSKAYSLIRRFSEDIDITFDYRGFKKLNMPLEKYSGSFLKKLGEELKNHVQRCVHQMILPYFKLAASDVSNAIEFDVSGDGEKFRVYYPSVFASSNTYVSSNILLEFGGRNSIEPSEIRFIKPYLAELVWNVLW
jgi:hypothetical protein